MYVRAGFARARNASQSRWHLPATESPAVYRIKLIGDIGLPASPCSCEEPRLSEGGLNSEAGPTIFLLLRRQRPHRF